MNRSPRSTSREKTQTDQELRDRLARPVAAPAPPLQPRLTPHNQADYDLGIWSLHYHLELKPEDTESRRELARRYICYGAHCKAVREYCKLLCLDPHCYDARLELADCYAMLEMWHEAARELRMLTMIKGYTQAAWQRLMAIDQQIPHIVTSQDDDTQQQVWEMLQQ